MNEQLTLSFNGILDSEQNPLSIEPVVVNLLLTPFYATESDISSAYLIDGSSYVENIRKIILNGSISIDNLIDMLGLKLNLSDKQLFIMKRDYVICYGIYELGKQINLDYLKSHNKSKFLGDVKVSLEIQNDPTFLTMTLEDAKHCLDSITKLLNDMASSDAMMDTFVKGELNPNNKFSWREWYNSYPLSTAPVAAVKHREYPLNKVSKVGTVLGKYYGSYSEL